MKGADSFFNGSLLAALFSSSMQACARSEDVRNWCLAMAVHLTFHAINPDQSAGSFQHARGQPARKHSSDQFLQESNRSECDNL